MAEMVIILNWNGILKNQNIFLFKPFIYWQCEFKIRIT